MDARKIARGTVTGVAALVAAGALSFTAAGSAAAAPPGVVCITNQPTIVRFGPPELGRPGYLLPAGTGFRLAGPEAVDQGVLLYLGHGNGRPDGWAPASNLDCPFQ